MKILYLALAVMIIVLCAIFFQHNASDIIEWIGALGVTAPIFFLLLYCVAAILLIPTTVLTLAGGALFGPIAGTLLNLLGATLGAVCAFCISRYLVFDWLAAKKNSRINQMIAGVEKQGWQFVALLRLMPIIPSTVVNYGLGVTRIKLSHYLMATAVFLLPTEIIFTYCGYAGMDMLSHPEDFYKGTGLLFFPCMGVLLFIYILVMRHQRQKIEEKEQVALNIPSPDVF